MIDTVGRGRQPAETDTLLPGNHDDEHHAAEVQPEKLRISTLRGCTLAIAIFFLIFDVTSNVSLITTIQSPIADDLNASTEVTWFTSAFMIAVTSVTPISGRLCQIFTPRIYLLASIVIQAIGLLIASQASNLREFLTGRVICGIGSAALAPVSFILVNELTNIKRRSVFFGLINTAYTTGVACGAIIAGALEPVVGWRAVFWLQIPFTLCAGAIAFAAIPTSKLEMIKSTDDDLSIPQKLATIDYFGVLTLVIALVLTLYTLSAPKISMTPLVLSFAMLTLFIFVEVKWALRPIIPISILSSKANMLTGIATVGIMSARWGVLFYTPVYAITLRNWSPSAAGLLLIPTNAGFASGGIFAGWLHIKRNASYFYSTLVCFGLFAIVQFCLSQLATVSSPLWLYIMVLFTNGIIVGALLNYSLAHLLYLTPASTHILVLPLNAMFRSFSGSFGSAVSGGYFLRTLYDNLSRGFQQQGMFGKESLIRQLLGSPRLVQSLSGVDRAVAIQGYTETIRALYIGGSVVAVAMLVIQAGTGWTPPKSKVEQAHDAADITRTLSQEPIGG